MEPRRFGPIAVRAAAIATASSGAVAFGAFAVGALALGTVAIGSFVAGRLSVRRAYFKDVRIDRLSIGELVIERHALSP